MPGPDETHIWQVRLDIAGQALAHNWDVLAEDERQRAERFRFERDRRAFVAARGSLRHILAHYLGHVAAELEFAVNEFGKPRLARPGAGPQFNVSHAGEHAVIAVAHRAVGVDIERIRPDFATQEIAERFFAPEEVQRLRETSLDRRAEVFFRCWTRKEAYIKARGRGLSIPLDSFAVSLDPDCPSLVRDTDPEPGRWRFDNLTAPPGYMAAVVVQEGSGNLLERRWEG